MNGPFLWFLNRGTGFVLLGLLTLTVVVGVLATHGKAGKRVPRFLTQSLHRNLGLVTVVTLVVHAATAVVDSYVDIRWWQALVPFGATYQPLWLGLGTLALDLMVVVVVTSLLRHRMDHRTWRVLHLSTYAVWSAAVAHGLGIGTDTGSGFAVVAYAACATAFALAVLGRLVGLGVTRRRDRLSARAVRGSWVPAPVMISGRGPR